MGAHRRRTGRRHPLGRGTPAGRRRTCDRRDERHGPRRGDERRDAHRHLPADAPAHSRRRQRGLRPPPVRARLARRAAGIVRLRAAPAESGLTASTGARRLADTCPLQTPERSGGCVTEFPLLPTSLVGSYPQPEWLIDRAKLAGRFPPRGRAEELWRVEPGLLAEAQDDATVVAVRAQERAGLDIVTDGEIRRESYSNHFATALEGVDVDNPGTALDRSGHPNPVPRVVGPIRRPHPVQVRDLRFLRSLTDRPVKITVPGPFTMSQQAQVEHYADPADAALDYAAAVNAEIQDLFAAGADIVQIDEPYMQARPDAAREYGVAALQRALDGVTGRTAVHICFGYAAIIHERPSGYSFLPELAAVPTRQVSIETGQSGLDLGVLRDLSDKTVILGVIDLSTPEVESVETVARRVRRAFEYLPPEQLVIAPDCGMKYLPRQSAEGKMRAMAGAAALLRKEL